MPHSLTEHEKQAMAWLRQFSNDLEIENSSLEDVRTELQALGADVQGFHKKLAATIHRAKLKRDAATLIAWLSPCWQPQWSGQWVGAADIPTQTHTFTLEHGRIDVSCTWRPKSGDNPAYLDLAWNADIVIDGELWCRFIRPETHEVLNELLLGTSREGGQYFTQQDLGFDPSHESWAIVILVKQP